MKCVRCQQENAPTMKFCGECGTPLTAANPSSPPVSSYAEIASALSEALDQQEATAELLRMRTREMADAQEQQTATGMILQVMSRSPADLQPIFDAIAESAVRLCDGVFSGVYRVDGDLIQLVALQESRDVADRMRRNWPRPLDRKTIVGQVILDRSIVHTGDLEQESGLPELSRDRARARLSESSDGADTEATVPSVPSG